MCVSFYFNRGSKPLTNTIVVLLEMKWFKDRAWPRCQRVQKNPITVSIRYGFFLPVGSRVFLKIPFFFFNLRKVKSTLALFLSKILMKTFSPFVIWSRKNPNYNASQKNIKTHVIENCPKLYCNLEIEGLFQRLPVFCFCFCCFVFFVFVFCRNDLTGIIGYKL